MKIPKMVTLVTLLSIIGTLVSIVGITASLKGLVDRLEFFVAIIAVLISFLAGLYSKYFALAIKKLSRNRRVFLSYPHEDRELARQIAAALRQAGTKVWIDEERIRPGDSLISVISKAIEDSDIFVALLSRNPKPNLMLELGMAKAKGVKIIPVLLESAEIPSDLQNLVYIDLRANKHEGIRKLVTASI